MAIHPTIGRGMMLIFIMPAIMQGFMHTPSQAVLQSLYAKEIGLSLAAIGGAVLLTRLFDAITDPLIGALSDAWHRKTGSRKAFVAVGTAVTMLGLWFLYRPPADASIVYFTGWFLVTYLGWTITEIPYRAWSMELSSDHATRTRIQASIGMAVLSGAAVFYLMPHAMSWLGLVDSTAITLKTVSMSALLIVVLIPIMIAITLWRVPNGERTYSGERPGVSLRDMWQAIRGNRPLLYFIMIFVLSGVFSNIGQAASFLYLDTYLGLSEQLSGIMLMVTPVTLIAIPIWGWVCMRYERHKVWAISNAIAAVVLVAYGLVPPGEGSLIPVTLIFLGLVMALSCSVVAAPAILGDVIDYGRWKFSQDHAGVYMSFFTLVQKTVIAVAAAGGFIILGWFGFDAQSATQTPLAAFGMRLTVAWLPAAGLIVLIPVLWRFPITRASHEQMINEIAARGDEATQSD